MAETTTDGHVRFAFIPFYLFWSLLIITLDILVIWAVPAHAATWRRSAGPPRSRAVLQDMTPRHHDDAEWQH